MTLKASLEAIRSDAASWDETAQVVGRAGFEASGLTLTAVELSWASLQSGFLDTYAELQAKTVRLLGEAETAYSSLCLRLDEVATAYEVNDEQAAQDLQGEWEVRD